MAIEEKDDDQGTMDDTIRETLRDLNAREDAGGDKSQEKAPAIGKENASAEPQIKERARDESGKFSKKDSAAQSAEAGTPPSSSDADNSAAAESAQPLVTTTGQPIDINRAPSSWKPAAKAAWAALPEQVRAEVYRRETDFMRGNHGLKENADFGQTIKQTVEPYRMLIEAEGGTPERAIADTLRTAALFRVGTPQQKMQALQALDQQFNIGFARALEANITQRLQGNGQQPPAQQVQQPQQQFADPRVDQIMASMQAQERARAMQEESVSNAATERFIGALDDKGQPLYPYVDNVLDDMTARVSQLRRANPSMPHEEILKAAYEASIWANPETRAVLIGQQQAQQQSQVEQLRKTDAAKRASRTNMPTRGALPAGAALGTMDDTIRDTLRQLTG